VKSTVSYGAETWNLTKIFNQNLFDRNGFFRKSARGSRLEKKRNNVIRENMNIKNSVLD
jgi:hypothetical protein